MSGKRQKTSTGKTEQQQLLAFAWESRSESPTARVEGIVPIRADSMTESPTSSDRLMESIIDLLNLECAMARVIANDGAPGVDGMKVSELEKYFERHSGRIIGELLAGTYRPKPVKRVEIPKTPSVLRDFDSWIHRRLRSYAWKQWKTGQRRFQELRKLGIGKDLAAQTAGSRKGGWHISLSPALNMSLTRAYLLNLGVPLLSPSTPTKV